MLLHGTEALYFLEYLKNTHTYRPGTGSWHRMGKLRKVIQDLFAIHQRTIPVQV